MIIISSFVFMMIDSAKKPLRNRNESPNFPKVSDELFSKYLTYLFIEELT